MTAEIISGTQVAADIRQELAQEVKELKAKGVTPGLAVVLVGEDPASISYVTAKAKGAEEVGVHEETFRLPADSTEDAVLKKVAELNQDPRFHGILVQLPLPKDMDEKKLTYTILPEKDVDAFHPVNVGKLLIGEPDFLPCTPHGVMQLLTRSGNDPSGKYLVIVGRSNIVGKPLMAMMVQKAKGANATVTVVHTGTADMAHYVKEADIVIAAAGRPNMVTAEMVKDGAVVIDVGVNRIPDDTKKSGFRLVGDVDFEAVKEKAKAITPVPGGVGPMTVTMLLVNTVRAAARTAGS
ncbi:MAG: bifunctional methylenetetrahydrofolate dehydrogenase/methenyltetrahydrofolate cyclohydrolase FolD [Dehalococcoidia bacterium]|jgi:methylenetetrahydrofolate dehydrogenase (NADP+)/methenyltetrahydrofolate cyclohydrolase|nr:bifunctional methylenetetrahydrofolate dehydrogenase/methenyltetrahydrofolate cyclohydrolase FolD [Dehalococcoidia bacterium]MDP7240533.1 bifunctional methylenetetrahydrofolate dehydrogenase/methenyltetrahydrofolate cyclohydrolase FolD [Dehalococcoidia bacterium]MDP7469343.1 bifunctional methylenetetrahydrofolate dehydrogenase/methenyltetrahydrofolate cyclohydrolase FolD [Dehalococcoidia bacterium]